MRSKRGIATACLAIVALVVGLLSAVPATATTRTAKAHFTKIHYRVHARHALTIRLKNLGRHARKVTCEISFRGPGFPSRTWRYHNVRSEMLISVSARKNVRSGDWTVGARCRSKGHGWSRWSHRRIAVLSHRQGSRSLVKSRGPFIDYLNDYVDPGSGGIGYPPNPFQPGQCTYWAYRMRPDIVTQSKASPGAPQSGWDAYRWASYASKYGHFASGTEPLVGSIMVEPPSYDRTFPSPVGHVAYVEKVFDANHFLTSEMNSDGRGTSRVFHYYNFIGTSGPGATDPLITNRRTPRAGTVFIYGGPVISPPQYAHYVNHIVQWDGDTKSQKTAWLVINDNGRVRREWIPTIDVFWCLKNSGSAGPDVLSAQDLDAMQDKTGVQATCTGNSDPGGGGGGGGGGAPVTYTEQQGHHGVNTFTNYHNASGLGTRIDAGALVQISCKVLDGTIASVNPDGYWYRIASQPWNNAYYAPANTFMNGDPWDGPYTHNTDFGVPNC